MPCEMPSKRKRTLKNCMILPLDKDCCMAEYEKSHLVVLGGAFGGLTFCQHFPPPAARAQRATRICHLLSAIGNWLSAIGNWLSSAPVPRRSPPDLLRIRPRRIPRRRTLRKSVSP
jgi:hypothetical protein